MNYVEILREDKIEHSMVIATRDRAEAFYPCQSAWDGYTRKLSYIATGIRGREK